MNISIAINENFGKLHTPKGFNSEAIGTQWRIDLANYLKEHAVTIPKEQLTVPKEQFTTYDGAESVETIPEYRQMDDFNYHEMV